MWEVGRMKTSALSSTSQTTVPHAIRYYFGVCRKKRKKSRFYACKTEIIVKKIRMNCVISLVFLLSTKSWTQVHLEGG